MDQRRVNKPAKLGMMFGVVVGWLMASIMVNIVKPTDTVLLVNSVITFLVMAFFTMRTIQGKYSSYLYGYETEEDSGREGTEGSRDTVS